MEYNKDWRACTAGLKKRCWQKWTIKSVSGEQRTFSLKVLQLWQLKVLKFTYQTIWEQSFLSPKKNQNKQTNKPTKKKTEKKRSDRPSNLSAY